VVMSIVWGIPYLLIKVSDEAISPAAFVFIRTAVAALMLVPYAAIRGQLRPAIQHWRAVLVFAAVEIAIPWVFLAQAEKRLPSSLTGLLIAAVPLVGTLLVRVTGERHHLGAGGLLGLAVGMAGVGVLVGFDIHGADVASAGEVAIVVLGYAIGPFMVSRYSPTSQAQE
jgi:drug/metabolite transporter (DMT)-like permease